jgi:hypothetical protein
VPISNSSSYGSVSHWWRAPGGDTPATSRSPCTVAKRSLSPEAAPTARALRDFRPVQPRSSQVITECRLQSGRARAPPAARTRALPRAARSSACFLRHHTPIPPKTRDHASANKAGSSFRGGGQTHGCPGLKPGSCTSPISDRSLRVNCSRPRATNSGPSRCRVGAGRTHLV